MKTPWIIPLVVAAVVILILISGVLFIVNETQQVVITQFGKPIGSAIKQAGLHFKAPFIQVANYFDKRLLEWDGNPTEIPTKDKKFIWVDTTARWRIVDPLLFMQSVRNEAGAHSRLDDIINGVTRDLITSHNLIEVVRDSNRLLQIEYTEDDISGESVSDSISVGREKITRSILGKAKESVKAYGIDLVDVRIKRINYVERVREKVFERMISERNRAAEKLRSEGQGVKAEIEGQKDRELRSIRSEAYKTAQEIKGKADAEAINIYAEAYNKDPEFYSFWKTLETYPETLKGKSKIILSTDGDYLKYLKSTAE